MPVIQSVLEVSAGLAAWRGEWKRAVNLFGAAETHAQTTGLRRDPADEAFLAPLMDNARRALGDSACRAAEAEGRVLVSEDAIAIVRAMLGPAQSPGR
jgi:hypothetical protein